MTITTSVRKAGPFPGNGSTTLFGFSFKVFTTADVLVTLANTSTGVETVQTLSTNYTVSLNADQNTNPGGTVTMLTAPATGYTLTLTSQVAQTQNADIQNAGGFYPQVVTTALDKLTILVQQLAEKLGRSITLPVSSTASAQLPSPVAGAYIVWDGSASMLTTAAGVASQTVSSAMAPVVAAATVASARTALGVTPANIGAAASGANNDIASLSALSGAIGSPTSIVGAATGMSLSNVSSINGHGLYGVNQLINSNFSANARGVSGTVTLSAGQYGHERWKAGAAGCTYTFATANNVTTLTITAGSLMQVIGGANLFSGNYKLSWTGTAQGRVDSGSYGASGVAGTAVGGTNQTIEFNTGTLSKPQYEPGSIASVWVPYLGIYGSESQACRRYLPIIKSGTNLSGYCPNTTGAYVAYAFPVEPNVAPTGISTAGTGFAYDATTAIATTGITLINATLTGASLQATVVSGLTAKSGTLVFATSDILFTGCEL